MKKKIELIIKLLIGITFFVPLVTIPSNFIFPFVVPKILIFRSLVLLMVGGYLLLLASDWERYKIRLTGTNIVVSLFFLSFTISSFIGVDWYRSFWDNHERMLGLFTIFHYVLYYYVISILVTEWKQWKWLLRCFLAAGTIVMLVGFWQKFINPEFFLNRNNLRVSATLGNPIYFSGYGLFLFFIGLLLIIKENKIAWKAFAIFGSLLSLWGIFGGGTRGTFLGLVAGLATLFLIYLFFLRQKRVRKILFVVTLLSIVCFAFLLFFRKSDFVRNIPLVGEVLNIDITEGTAYTRSMAWRIAIDAWQEKIFFGWGPNNYYYAFNKYYKPEFLELGWGETWFDNAHSSIMNTLAVQGIIGLILYIGLFAVPAYSLWKSKKNGQIDIHFFAIASGFLVAHFFHNAFVFENPTSYLYFFFFLAMVNQSTEMIEEKNEEKNEKIKTTTSSIFFILVLFLIYVTNINPARANTATLEVIKQIQVGGNIKEYYQEASKIATPHVDDIRNDFAHSLSGIISHLVQSGNKEMAQDMAELAYEELEKNRELHPLDIRVHIQQVQLDQVMAQINQDFKYLFDAEKILEDALAKSPKRQQIQYSLATIKLQLGKGKEAVDILQESIDNDEKISEGWWRLALMYNQIGEIKKAKEIISEAKNRGLVFSEQNEKLIEQITQATSTIR